MQTVVLGGGSWGTALAHVLATNGFPVTLLVRDAKQAEEISSAHVNSRYTPGLPLAPSLTATTNPAVIKQAGLCVIAIPCQSIRQVLTDLRPYLTETIIPLCASKGLEVRNLCRMEEVVAASWPEAINQYAILSGPAFAQEVLSGQPTAVVIGSRNTTVGPLLQRMFSSSSFRVYSSTDVIGVELGGALKNIIAIATGISDGLGYEGNSRASLITRGLAEISRLGIAMGANPATFMGLSGMGDLVLTCSGDLSRNRQVGLRIGKGETLNDIIQSMHNVAEGVKTTEAAHALTSRLGIEMPVTNAVYDVLYNNIPPREMAQQLMTRALREE